jgi:hypothetical protein
MEFTRWWDVNGGSVRSEHRAESESFVCRSLVTGHLCAGSLSEDLACAVSCRRIVVTGSRRVRRNRSSSDPLCGVYTSKHLVGWRLPFSGRGPAPVKSRGQQDGNGQKWRPSPSTTGHWATTGPLGRGCATGGRGGSFESAGPGTQEWESAVPSKYSLSPGTRFNESWPTRLAEIAGQFLVFLVAGSCADGDGGWLQFRFITWTVVRVFRGPESIVAERVPSSFSPCRQPAAPRPSVSFDTGTLESRHRSTCQATAIGGGFDLATVSSPQKQNRKRASGRGTATHQHTHKRAHI